MLLRFIGSVSISLRTVKWKKIYVIDLNAFDIVPSKNIAVLESRLPHTSSYLRSHTATSAALSAACINIAASILHSCTAALQTYTSTTTITDGTYTRQYYLILVSRTTDYITLLCPVNAHPHMCLRVVIVVVSLGPSSLLSEKFYRPAPALTRYYYYNILSSPAFCHVRAAAHLNYVHDEPPPPHCCLS